MKHRLRLILVVVLGAAVLRLVTLHRPDVVAEAAAPAHPGRIESVPAGPAPPAPGDNESPADAGSNADIFNPAVAVPVRPGRGALAAALVSGPAVGPGLAPQVVLENMRSVFRQYSARFGGNPVGTNPEITRALNGGNPGKVVFLSPEDGLRVNGKGELIDNWGAPFFFHQLSGTEMEIHSAGPDGKMWTADDLVTR